jgi:hypothetical protein
VASGGVALSVARTFRPNLARPGGSTTGNGDIE